jgi:hypothetical protein
VTRHRQTLQVRSVPEQEGITSVRLPMINNRADKRCVLTIVLLTHAERFLSQDQ